MMAERMYTPPDFKPLNPWGRRMPKLSSQFTEKPRRLYQVWVDDREGKTFALGPKVIRAVADDFLVEIKKAIIQAGPRALVVNPRLYMSL